MEDATSRPTLQKTDTIPSSDLETTSQVIQPAIQRIGSVLRDAEKIAALLDIENFDAIYERVKTLRTQKDRTGIVINEILEGGLNSTQNGFQEIAKDRNEDLLSDLEVVKLSVKDVYPDYNMNLDDVYSLLEQHRSKPERAALVKDLILQQIDQGSTNDNVSNCDVFQFLSTETAVFNDMETLINKYSQVEPHHIFQIMVSKFLNSSNRIQDVSTYLDSPKDTEENGGTKLLQTDLITDSLIKDTEKLAVLFPNRDKNEIYAHLEAHVRDVDRVQLVTSELLRADTTQGENQTGAKGDTVTVLKPQASLGTKRTKDASKQFKMIKRLKSQGSVRSKKYIELPYPELQREKEVELLHAVFPDCDPNFLFEKLESMTDDPERVNRLSHEMFENADYPKLKDRLKREQRQRRLQQLLSQEPDFDDFLLMFPTPETVFEDKGRKASSNYKNHVLIQLKNDFPRFKVDFIEERMEENQHLYFFSHHSLEHEIENPDDPAILLSQPREKDEYPEILDEFFFKELFYTTQRQKINDFIQKRDDEKKEKLENAVSENQAKECEICCVDVLQEDLVTCDNDEEDYPHYACGKCIQDVMKEYMSQGRVAFACMQDGCTGNYPLHVIKKYLPSSTFSVLLRRMQEDEIRRAHIPDLVSCPFCSFATIMTNPDDKVLKCLNPECLVESCRLCQEPNHVPLRCEEIVKQGASDMKSYIEMKMTEAMIRTCWRCKKRYFKTEGCNRMTCSCGASMCYLCKRPINSYDHFDNSENGCPMQSDAMDQNRNDMERAAVEAKEEWLKEHPEDANLEYDPLDMIRKKVVRRKKMTGDEEEYEEVEVNPLTEYYEQHGLLDEDIDELEFNDE